MISAAELALTHQDGRVAIEAFDATLRDIVNTIGATDAVEILARAGFHLLMRRPDRADQIQKGGLELFHRRERRWTVGGS